MLTAQKISLQYRNVRIAISIIDRHIKYEGYMNKYPPSIQYTSQLRSSTNREVYYIFSTQISNELFDSVKREALLEDLKVMEMQGNLRRLVEMTMNRSKTTILTEEGETEKFEFITGVRQGDGLSTTLFNISLDTILR